MTETPTTTSLGQPIFPPGRYGRRRGRRRSSPWLIALVAVGVAVASSAVAVGLYNTLGERDYSANVTAFADITDTQVVVTFQVRLPAGGAARCVVRARDVTGAEAGREVIDVKAGPNPSKTVVTHRLVTRSRPVTGEVQGCRPA